MVFVVVVLIYLSLGMLLTYSFIKWGGLPDDDFAIVVLVLWPMFGIMFGIWFCSSWVQERTSWYKRRKWRKRLRIVVSEENETDESFLRRAKRL